MSTIRRPRCIGCSHGYLPILRDRGKPQLLVLTTNYDDLTERAFDEAGEAYDVVWYEAKPGGSAGPLHASHLRGGRGCDQAAEEVHGPGVRLSAPSILKLHGAIDRCESKGDSFVVTEDSYIDYLTGNDVGSQIPFSVPRADGGHHSCPGVLDASTGICV